jgi:glycosyltransferase 2 family protein
MLEDRSRAQHGAVAPPAIRRVTFAQIAKVLFSLVIGALLVYGLHKGGVPLVPPAHAFAHVRWWTVVAYLGLLAASSYFRGIRWRLLLRPVAPVSSLEALSAVFVGSAAVLLLPLRLGETVRPIFIARTGRVSVLSALGTVVAERIIDGLVLSLILGAALLIVPTIVPLPQTVVGIPIATGAVRGYAWTFLVTFAAAFTAILVFHSARAWGIRLTHAVFDKVSPRLAATVASTLERFADGLSFFRYRALALRFFGETGLYWFLGALGYWLLGWGTGVVHADQSPLSFGEACAIMGMLGIAAALPGPPGLIGLFQAGAYAAMTMYFPREVVTGPGAAYVFLLYVMQVGFILISAAVCLVLSALRGARSLVPNR